MNDGLRAAVDELLLVSGTIAKRLDIEAREHRGGAFPCGGFLSQLHEAIDALADALEEEDREIARQAPTADDKGDSDYHAFRDEGGRWPQ